MKAKRLWWTIRTCFIRGGGRRADFARKHGIYQHVGKSVAIQSRVIPVYPELISFGNNVQIARNVDFCTHDVIYAVLNRLPAQMRNSHRFRERIGCIEINDNCFIGSNTVVLYGVSIGPNVIVGSGSVVVKDCEPNSVYAGVPASKIGSFEDFVDRRIDQEESEEITTTTHNQCLTEDEVKQAWEHFKRAHK